MDKIIMSEMKDKMEKACESTKKRLGSIRAGKASVSMLDGIQVESYGALSPLSQVANISAPEARMLTIDPWDKGMLGAIDKAIQTSNLGIMPNNDGKIIRIQIPELTSDRRKEYVKLAKKDIEEGKIAVRNIRKDSNNGLRKLQKDSEITEDELKLAEVEVQKITDSFIKVMDELHAKKEKEILTV